MIRRALLLAAAALLLAAAPARAADRLDTLAQTLRDAPLAVDADLAWLLSDEQRATLETRLRESPVPFHVAVLPALDEDESGGDQYRQLEGLADRLDEPGVYLVVDEAGVMEAATVQVPRDTQFTYEQLTGSRGLETAGAESGAERDFPQRLASIVDDVASAPPAEPAGFDATLDREDQSDPESDDVATGDFLAVLAACLVIGIAVGGLLYGFTAFGIVIVNVRRRA